MSLDTCPECRWPKPGQGWPDRHDHDPDAGACYACDNPCSMCDEPERFDVEMEQDCRG